MEAPEKIYVTEGMIFITNPEIMIPGDNKIEYIHADAFVEKACEKLEKCMYDNLMFQGRLHRKEAIETFIEDFKKRIEKG